MADKHLTEAKLGFYDEDNLGVGAYGVRNMDGTPANTVTYAIGDFIGSFPIPVEKPAWIDRGSFISFDYNELKAGAKKVEFVLKYQLLEGPPLLYALGPIQAAPSGGDNAWIHTLTPITPAIGFELPSRTGHIQIENSLTVDRYIDIPGCITETLDVGGKSDQSAIEVSEKFNAQRITDENATSDLLGVPSAGSEDDAIDFTAAPAYYDPNITPEDFFYLESLWIGGVDITKDIKTWNLRTKNEFEERRANRVGTDNYGRTINNYVGAYLLKKRRYEVSIGGYPTDETYPIWQRMQAGNIADNDIVVNFTRTKKADGLENTMVWTYDTAVCPVIDITGMVQFELANDQSWTFVLQPKTLTNIVITDDVADYGIYEPDP